MVIPNASMGKDNQRWYQKFKVYKDRGVNGSTHHSSPPHLGERIISNLTKLILLSVKPIPISTLQFISFSFETSLHQMTQKNHPSTSKPLHFST